MRFLRVTFRCFGPFEEQTLELAEAGRLYLVFGANEAGKSSALRGLHAFLFGFPSQSKDNFRFQHKQFRVQAVVENPAGEQLECIRRKGNKETLRKSCDKAIMPDSQLADFIGGLDEHQFEQLFGLDAERLVAGGKDIAAGHGDLGEALFAAGAGMKGLRQLSHKLQGRQQDLYLSGGKKQSITEALRKHREQLDSVRNLELAPETYAAAESASRLAREHAARLVDERKNARVRLGLLNRYSSALGTIELLQTARERFAKVADAPLLSADFDAKLENARRQFDTATLEIQQLKSVQNEQVKRLEEYEPPAVLLREEHEIDELRGEISAELKSRNEEIKAETFSIDELGKARDIYRALKGSTDWDQMDALKPRDDQRNRIHELSNERSATDLDVKREENDVRQIGGQLDEARQALANVPSLDDPAPLQKLVDEIMALGPLEAQYEQGRKSVQTEERNLEAQFGRLQPAPTISWRNSPVHPVPLPEAIERFREDIDSANNKVSQVEDQQSKAQSELESLTLSFVNTIGSEPVPSTDELMAARQDRDGGLHGVRSRLSGHPDAVLESDFTRRHAVGRPLIDAVEHSVRQCDSLADRLRNEADRVAACQSFKRHEQVLQGRITELTASRQAAQSDLAVLEKQWRESWQQTGIVPDSPKVMRAWLASWTKLRDGVTNWQEASRQCENCSIQLTLLRRQLADHCPTARNTKSLAEGLTAARIAIADARKATADATTFGDSVRRLEKESGEAEERLDRARTRQLEWERQWATAVSVLGLSDDGPSVETAQSYLTSIARMQQHLTDKRIKDARIREIQGERVRTIQRLNALRTRIDPSVRASDAQTMESYFRTLQSALDDARDKRTRRQELSNQLEGTEDKLRGANTGVRESRVALQVLAEEAGVTVEELPSAVQKARERSDATQRVHEFEKALAALAQSEPLPLFEAGALAHRAELESELEELHRKVEQLDLDVTAAEAAAQEKARILGDYLKASDAAAEAKQQAELIAAKLEDQIKEYAALTVARAVLEQTKVRYRAQHQDTMLERAGEFFKSLTNGAFSGVEIDSDEGEDFLAAVRSAKTTDGRVKVDGLSDGTRDQLFLALRLAAIEQHLGERGPVPLIVDDVLINFDDERSKATLNCLAQLAKKTQVIVFTHHRHLVELAQSVEPATQVIKLGPRS